MFVRLYHRQSAVRLLWGMGFLLISGILLIRPQAMMTGISRGLSVCADVIIPTLYPFMILAGALIQSPLCRTPGRISEWLTRRFFALPGCCGPAILISLIGGYPAGSLAIGQLRQQGSITTVQAERMTLFCVNAGPGYIIGTIGAGLLGSTRAGLLLFAAHVITSLGIGILTGLRHHGGNNGASPAKGTAPPPPPGRSAAQVVSDTCEALLHMCGFVILGCVLLSLCAAMGLPALLGRLTGCRPAVFSTLIAAVTEVSCGCLSLAGTGDAAPFLFSLCLGWGGISVHGQLASACRDTGVRILCSRFLLFRLLHGTISGILSLLLFRFIPAPAGAGIAAVAVGEIDLTSSSTLPACIMLLGLTFFAMLCFTAKNAEISAKKTGNVSAHVIQ